MTTLKPEQITSFTMPAEIVTLDLAVAYRDFWQKKFDKMNLPGPRRPSHQEGVRNAPGARQEHSRSSHAERLKKVQGGA
jgi:hypothetical protein